VSETSSHFLCYCPFHGNRNDPAFAADKIKGLWTCFNPSCGESGTLLQLVQRRTGKDYFQAFRVILKYQTDEADAEQMILDAWSEEPEFVAFPQEPLDRMYAEFAESAAEAYMMGRHFTKETLDYFKVGFSAAKWVTSKKTGNPYLKPDMVIVPMHDPTGMPVGLIGRTISGEKRFKNSDNLPKSLTMWNLHRAKRAGATVIIVESSFDAMRVHQAGYPNVIALLGGSLSPQQIHLLNRYFDTIVIMTDFDKKRFEKPGQCKKCKTYECEGHRAGRELGRHIATALPNKNVYWAAYDDECVFPYNPIEGYREGPAKDTSDMTDEEIRQCLKNAVSHYQYIEWGIDENVLPWELESGTIDV